MSNSEKPWPEMVDYPQTELGWNQYAKHWIARRRMTAGLAQIPIAAIEEHRAAMALGREKGWEEIEEVWDVGEAAP